MSSTPVPSIKARVLFLLVASIGLVGAGALQAHAAASRTTVLSMKLDGVVDPFMASYIDRGIQTANSDGDAAVLIYIDTPGGLSTSMHDMIKAILSSKIPVICYTAPSGSRAASAGTFIMMACPVSVMAPGTNIGAAHPVGVQGAIEMEKVTNDAVASIRSSAELWGRNADWAEKAVRQAVSASAEEALSLKVVDLVEPNTGALLARAGPCQQTVLAPPATGLLHLRGTIAELGCNPQVVPFKMSLSESLFHAFADPNIAFLFVELGFIALIVWVIHPALHVSLAVGVIFTILGFAILETLPVRLTGLLLLAISAVLFVLDVKAKAHGVLSAGGIVTLILGGLLLFNPSVPSAHVSVPLLIGVAAAVALFMLFVVRAIVAAKDAPARSGTEWLIGSAGVATSNIDREGTVRARAETWTAESTAGPISAGSPVRVVGVRGVKLLVQPTSVEESEDGALIGGAKEGKRQ